MRRSKRYKKQVELLKDTSGAKPLAEAIKLVKQFADTKFDQSVDCVMHLGIDPRQADQQVRGSISLPNGIGKKRRVIAFCQGEAVDQAVQAGAIEAGGEELIKKVQDGWVEFDVAIAAPDMMRLVGRLGRILGPQGKMPSPKSGTVSADVASAVKDYVAGKVEYRNDAGGNIHAVVGKLSFEEAQLEQNIDAFIGHIRRSKPAASKGIYIRKICISATISPAVQVVV